MTRTRLTTQNGFTYVEALIAAFVLTLVMLGAVGAFASSKRTTASAKRHLVATRVAQAELDRLRAINFANLRLSGAPAASPDPATHVVGFGHFQWSSPGVECIAYVGGPCESGSTSGAATPTSRFTVGTESGTVYRYVTYRGESCPAATCDNASKPRRVTVAVTLDQNGARPSGPRDTNAIWLSTVVVNPDAVSQSAPVQPPPASTTESHSLFLYAAACDGDAPYPGAPRADQTHNTASWGVSPLPSTAFTNQAPGYCENTNSYTDSFTGNSERRRPDLMGMDQVGGTTGDPLRNYSADIARPSGSPDGGLVMKSASSCQARPHYSATDDGSRATAYNDSRWNMHAWSTGRITRPLHLGPRLGLTIYGAGLGGNSQQVSVCASLILRRYLSGAAQVTDEPLVDATTSGQNQTCTPTFPASFDTNAPSVCQFELDTRSPRYRTNADGTTYWDVPADGTYRLVLTLRIRSANGASAAFAYDSPDYPSSITVNCERGVCGL